MEDMKAYVDHVLEQVIARDPEQIEYHNAVKEVLYSIIPALERDPKYRQERILERIVEPERVVTFRVPWEDDKGELHINRGYRIQASRALGSCMDK